MVAPDQFQISWDRRHERVTFMIFECSDKAIEVPFKYSLFQMQQTIRWPVEDADDSSLNKPENDTFIVSQVGIYSANRKTSKRTTHPRKNEENTEKKQNQSSQWIQDDKNSLLLPQTRSHGCSNSGRIAELCLE